MERNPNDAVDAIAAAWRRERPELPVESIGVITRVWQVAKLLGDERTRLLRAHGADTATLDLLSTLRRQGEPYRMNTRDLAAASLITAGAITQRVDRAEREGLVRRMNRAGSRTVDVELTDRGIDTVDRLVTAVLTREQELLEGLAPEHREQLAGLLGELLRHLSDELGDARVGQVGHRDSGGRR